MFKSNIKPHLPSVSKYELCPKHTLCKQVHLHFLLLKHVISIELHYTKTVYISFNYIALQINKLFLRDSSICANELHNTRMYRHLPQHKSITQGKMPFD